MHTHTQQCNVDGDKIIILTKLLEKMIRIK